MEVTLTSLAALAEVTMVWALICPLLVRQRHG